MIMSEKIRFYRKKRGLSQQELADKLNVVRQTVSKWEQGLSVPDSQMLVALARELGISVALLLGEAELGDGNECDTCGLTLADNADNRNAESMGHFEGQRKVFRAFFIVFAVFFAVFILYDAADLIHCLFSEREILQQNSVIGGAVSKTGIYIFNLPLCILRYAVLSLLLGLCVTGIYKTQKK